MSRDILIADASVVFTRRGADVTALQDVSLLVPAGRFTAIIGPSGCGKSTLLRLVADILPPSSGSIAIGGTPPRAARRGHAIDFVFQQPTLLPCRPASVAAAAASHPGVLLARAGYTLGSALVGLAASGLFAAALSLAFASSPRLAQASLPLMVAFRSAPVVAVAPLIMLMVGRGIGTSVIVVMIVSFFPIHVNLMRGLLAPDRSAVELMMVTGATRWQQLRYVRIPYALPFLFTGLRVAGGSAILGAMLSEWLTGAPGLGMLILSAGDMRETELLWAATILTVLVALCVFWATSAGERALLPWRQ